MKIKINTELTGRVIDVVDSFTIKETEDGYKISFRSFETPTECAIQNEPIEKGSSYYILDGHNRELLSFRGEDLQKDKKFDMSALDFLDYEEGDLVELQDGNLARVLENPRRSVNLTGEDADKIYVKPLGELAKNVYSKEICKKVDKNQVQGSVVPGKKTMEPGDFVTVKKENGWKFGGIIIDTRNVLLNPKVRYTSGPLIDQIEYINYDDIE